MLGEQCERFSHFIWYTPVNRKFPVKLRKASRTPRWQCILVLSLLFLPSFCIAANTIIPHSYTKFGIGAEWFSWETEEPATSEAGPRLTLALSADNFQRYEPGAVFGLEGKIYAGRMELEGINNTTENPEPVQTNSDYIGLRLEGTLGYGGNRTNIFAVLGADAWQRTVHEVKTVDEHSLPGFDEQHLIVYGKLGGTIREYDYYTDLGFPLPFEISAGFKFPLFVAATRDGGENKAEATIPAGRTNTIFIQLSKRFWMKYAISIYSEFYQIDNLSESFNDSVTGDEETIKRLQKDISIVGLQLSRRF